MISGLVKNESNKLSNETAIGAESSIFILFLMSDSLVSSRLTWFRSPITPLWILQSLEACCFFCPCMSVWKVTNKYESLCIMWSNVIIYDYALLLGKRVFCLYFHLSYVDTWAYLSYTCWSVNIGMRNIEKKGLVLNLLDFSDILLLLVLRLQQIFKRRGISMIYNLRLNQRFYFTESIVEAICHFHLKILKILC